MGKLRILSGVPASEVDVHLVLVKGLGPCPVEEWAICSPSWRNFLSSTESRVGILVYDYDLALNDSFTLESLLGEGKILLESLSQYQTDTEAVRPLVFMCHSLGAFILKQALCISNSQSQRFTQLLNSILGIVFLGGPHAASNVPTLSERSLLILRTIPNTISKPVWERLIDELNLLDEISRLFHDMELRMEILSLYETKQTRVKVGLKEGKGFFGSYRKLILVDENVAAIGAPREQCFGLAGEHSDLYKLEQSDGQPDQRLKEWMRFVLGKNSLAIIDRRLKSLMITKSPAASLTSLSSHDAARIALSSELQVITPQDFRSNDPTASSSKGNGWEIVPIINGFATPRRPVQLPCFMMETLVRNKYFFGREFILQKLDECLMPSKNASNSPGLNTQKHIVLCGMGGIGKTSIAMEFAFSRREKFDAIFWIHADETTKLDKDFCQIASKLDLEDSSEPPNPVISRALVKGWLESPKNLLDDSDLVGQTEAHWLLIFDNADNPDILQDYWPLSGAGSILVTSRDPLAKTSPSFASVSIDVESFSDVEAASLLRHLSHVNREEDVSLKVAKKLGGLPLAISQMAAIIRYQYLSFSDFLERYEDECDRKELHAFEARTPHREARGNIASIWAVEQLQPQAKTILEICSILDPDCIQERIFLTDISSVKLLDDFPNSTFTYSKARADLIRRSLIKRNEEKREIWVHRVLQDSIQMKMSAERMLIVFSAAVSLVATAWGSTPLDKRHVLSLSKSREGLFPHVLTLKVIYEKLYQDINPKAGIQLAFLLNEAGWFQHERGNSQDIKSLLALALNICVRDPGEEATQLLADIHYCFSAVASETNDGNMCLRHTKVLLGMRLEAFKERGEIDLRLAVAHNQIGIAWVMNREHQKAIEAFEKSIQVYRALEDYWLAMDTNPRANIGFTCWVIGNLDVASKVFEDLLRDREARFGLNDTESYRTGRVYHGLGNVRFDQGRFEESEEWHQRALSQYQITIGNNHHKTADLCYRVAQHCMRRGEIANARSLIDQALKVWQLRESIYIPELARVKFLKAKLLMQSGDNATAIVLFKDAKRLRGSISGATKKADVELRESDFDELLTFYSR